MRTIETQLVQYKHDNVFYASCRLLHMFSAYSDIPKTEQWTRSFAELKQVINRDEPTELLWHGYGIDLYFSGFKNPSLKIENDKNNQPTLVFRSAEPYFAVREVPDILLPSERTHYFAVVDSIASEMEETYKLKVDKSPVRMTFPKQLYAREIVNTAALELSHLNR